MKSPVLRPQVVFVGHVARLSGGELALLRTLPPLLPQITATVVLAETGPLVGALQELGVRVVVLPLGNRVRDARRTEVTTARVPWRDAWELASHVVRLARLLRSLHADVVHTNTLKAAVYGGLAGRLARVPVVWHVRDRIAPDYLPRSAVRLIRLLALLLPTAVIANSRSTLSTLPDPRRWGGLRGTVVSNALVPDSVVRPAPPCDRSRGVLTIGVVGRLSPWKGQHVFLAALAAGFPQQAVRGRLIGSAMFGEEAYEEGLRVQIEALELTEAVELRGFREDVWAELAELDLAVHCSTLPEPFGQVVLEAMAAGVPIIASAEGGPAEIIRHGIDGWLVPPRDPAALAEAMQHLVGDEDLRARLVAEGRRTAATYTAERTSAGILEVYRSVLAGRRGRRSPTSR